MMRTAGTTTTSLPSSSSSSSSYGIELFEKNEDDDAFSLLVFF